MKLACYLLSVTLLASIAIACSSPESPESDAPSHPDGSTKAEDRDASDGPTDRNAKTDGGDPDEGADSAANDGAPAEEPRPAAACTSSLRYLGNSKAEDQTLSVESGKLVVRAQSTATCLATLEQAERTGDFETRLRIESFTAGRYGQVLATIKATNGAAGVSLFQDGTNPVTVTASAQGFGQCAAKSIPSPALPLSVRLTRAGKVLTAHVTDAAGKVASSSCEIASAAAASEPATASLTTSNSDAAPLLLATVDEWITTGDKACSEDFSAKRF